MSIFRKLENIIYNLIFISVVIKKNLKLFFKILIVFKIIINFI